MMCLDERTSCPLIGPERRFTHKDGGGLPRRPRRLGGTAKGVIASHNLAEAEALMTGFLDKLDLSHSRSEIADHVLEIWREYQAELGKNGVSDRAKQLELDVWRSNAHGWRLVSTCLPEEKIPRLAFDNPRPPRLTRWDTYGEAD